MCLCPESLVHVHGHGVQLSKGIHRLHQQDNKPASFDSLNSSC